MDWKTKQKWIIPLIFAGEFILNVLIINFVKYTEIDWVAYMDEVGGVHNGTFDYMLLKGDTGPLVYPGGFVFIFYLLFLVTGFGENVVLAQYIFAGFYLAFILLLLFIYKEDKNTPFWLVLFLSLSRRIHSIFVLRLFNDCVAMLFAYAAIYLFLKDRWTLGCFFYSFGVGVKMNVLLFAPGLLILLLKRFGWKGTIPRLSLCAALQIVFALPFVTTNAVGYITRSFDLGRVFIYYWSVNWQFIPEEIFVSAAWGKAMLGVTLVTWAGFGYKQWIQRDFGILFHWRSPISGNIDPNFILSVLFTSNFIGICFARSLHYQFYVWYFHTLPFLLWSTQLHLGIKLLLLLAIEACWNIFPARASMSLVLFGSHMLILLFLWLRTTQKPTQKPTPKSD